MAMQPDDYRFLCQILAEGSGLALGANKEYLVESRLGPVAKMFDAPDIAALVARLRASRDRNIERTICEAMTTNESLFFRDGAPFEALKKRVLPVLAKARAATRRIRIWSAASSTGQEAYSISITRVLESPAIEGYHVEIVGTDLSRSAVERAQAGVFSHFEVQRGLPPALLTRCFTQVPEGWRVNDAFRQAVTFRQFNLLHDFSPLGMFDVIFCRNVMIYFDGPTKTDVLGRLAKMMPADGVLFLGGAESILGISDAFTRRGGESTSVYRRR